MISHTLRATSNPVLLHEMRARMRGARAYWVLFGYLLVVAVTLAITAMVTQFANSTNGFDLPCGPILFAVLTCAQAILIALIAPAASCGAITLEREHQSYELLASTRMNAHALVWGKFTATLSFIFLCLAASLPLVLAAAAFGGLAPDRVVAAYVLLALEAAVFGAVGIFSSSLSRSTIVATVLAFPCVAAMSLVTLPGGILGMSLAAQDRMYGSANGFGVLAGLCPFTAGMQPPDGVSVFDHRIPFWVPGVLILIPAIVLFCSAAARQLPLVTQPARSWGLPSAAAVVILLVFFLTGGLLSPGEGVPYVPGNLWASVFCILAVATPFLVRPEDAANPSALRMWKSAGLRVVFGAGLAAASCGIAAVGLLRTIHLAPPEIVHQAAGQVGDGGISDAVGTAIQDAGVAAVHTVSVSALIGPSILLILSFFLLQTGMTVAISRAFRSRVIGSVAGVVVGCFMAAVPLANVFSLKGDSDPWRQLYLAPARLPFAGHPFLPGHPMPAHLYLAGAVLFFLLSLLPTRKKVQAKAEEVETLPGSPTRSTHVPHIPMILGILGGITALAGIASGAQAAGISFKQEMDRGVTVTQVGLVALANGRVPGSWMLLRFAVQAPVSIPNAGLSIRTTEDSEWRVPVAIGSGASTLGIAVPETVLSRCWSVAFTISQAGRPVAAGFLGDSPRNHKGEWHPIYGSGSAVPASGPNLGGEASFSQRCPDAWQSGGIALVLGSDIRKSRVGQADNVSSLSLADLSLLAGHAECLDSIVALCVPSGLQRWAARPGIREWIQSGGVLAAPTRGARRVEAVGAGTIVEYPGVMTVGDLQRLVLATRDTYFLWGSDGTLRRGYPFWLGPTQSDYPGFDAPTTVLLCLMGGYAVLILPLNYLLLRKIRRKEASWITIPCVAILFTLIVWQALFGLKGRSPAAERITLLEQDTPGCYSARGCLSVFSPRWGTFTASLPSGALPDAYTADGVLGSDPVSSNWFSQQTNEGQDVRVRMLVPPWSSNSVGYRFTPAVKGAITGTAEYDPSAGWRIAVSNNSSLSLEDCRVWAAGSWLEVGALPPGVSRTLIGHGNAQKPFTDDTPPKPVGTWRERVRHREMDRFLISKSGNSSPRGVWLVGHTRQALQPGTIKGISSCQDEAILMVPIRTAVGPESLAAPYCTIVPHRGSVLQWDRTVAAEPTMGADGSVGQPIRDDLMSIEIEPGAASNPHAALDLVYKSWTFNNTGSSNQSGAQAGPNRKFVAGAISAWVPVRNAWEGIGTFPAATSPLSTGRLWLRLAPLARYLDTAPAVDGRGPRIYIRSSGDFPGVKALGLTTAEAPDPHADKSELAALVKRNADSKKNSQSQLSGGGSNDGDYAGEAYPQPTYGARPEPYNGW